MEHKNNFYKLPDSVQEDILSYTGSNGYDICVEYTNTELLDAYLKWNGIIGYTDKFLGIVETLWGVSLS